VDSDVSEQRLLSNPAMMSCTSTAGCTWWVTPSKLLTWPRRSAGGPAPRSSPSTTGSPPSIRTRQRSMTPLPPTRPSCNRAPLQLARCRTRHRI